MSAKCQKQTSASRADGIAALTAEAKAFCPELYVDHNPLRWFEMLGE